MPVFSKWKSLGLAAVLSELKQRPDGEAGRIGGNELLATFSYRSCPLLWSLLLKGRGKQMSSAQEALPVLEEYSRGEWVDSPILEAVQR